MDTCANLSPYEKCLAVIAHGLDALHQGDLTSAEVSFRVALMVTQSAPPEQALNLVPLVLYSQSLLRLRQGRANESRQLREQAALRMKDDTPSLEMLAFHGLMASVLEVLGEYRRAIPFYERAIQMDRHSNDAFVMADMLWHVGNCYSRCGLKDHASVPLRAAAKVFLNHPEDPRLSAVLVALGNALRKSAPSEAESFYRKAADLHVARAQLQSATPAWVNLAILCSEQCRYAESLEYNDRVLRVREQSMNTPPERIGSVLNNIANCYRRMAKFTEALESVDRAIRTATAERRLGSGGSVWNSRVDFS